MRISELVQADKVPGGKADDKTDSDFDPEQLDMGQKVEMEHTTDPELAREIARDHLEEFPDYYTRLKVMEDKAKQDKQAGFHLLAQGEEHTCPEGQRWCPITNRCIPGERPGRGLGPGGGGMIANLRQKAAGWGPQHWSEADGGVLANLKGR